MIIRDSFDNKGLIIVYVMIDVGQDLLRQHLTNILKGEETHWGKLMKGWLLVIIYDDKGFICNRGWLLEIILEERKSEDLDPLPQNY